METRTYLLCICCGALVKIHITTLYVLAQDKGGPSKGGFLNNRLFSYTDLYLCNEINGMCM